MQMKSAAVFACLQEEMMSWQKASPGVEEILREVREQAQTCLLHCLKGIVRVQKLYLLHCCFLVPSG